MLFAEGWAFFVPYVAIYLAASMATLSDRSVRILFGLCHVLLLILFVQFGARELARRYGSLGRFLRDAGAWFWMALIAGFVIAGAWLEFPGDPWEHFRRLNLPRPDEPLGYNSFFLKFAYFWGWTFLSLLSPSQQRVGLDLYSAFWQTLVAIQFYRLSKTLGFSPAWSRIQLLALLAFFGKDVVGFLRQYALSSTPLAYVAYLRGAIAILDVIDGRARRSAAYPIAFATAVIMLTNHLQEALLFAVFTTTVILLRLCSSLPASKRKHAFILAAVVFIGGLAIGQIVMRDPHAYGIHPIRVAYPYFSALGTYRIWDPDLSYAKTIGLHGLLGSTLAFACWRVNPRVAALTVAPVLFLLFPPFAILLALMTDVTNTWRVLFVFPDTVMTVAGLQALGRRIASPPPNRRAETRFEAVVIVVILAVGTYAAAPIYGKLRFQYHSPAPCAELAHLDPAAEWFAENRRGSESCVVMSDPVTQVGLSSFRGTAPLAGRGSDKYWSWGAGDDDGDYAVLRWDSPQQLEEYYHASLGVICGFLVLDDSLFHAAQPETCRSWVGAVTRRWPPDAADLGRHQPPGFQQAAAGLARLGWSKTFVPPFYWYYEPGRRRTAGDSVSD